MANDSNTIFVIVLRSEMVSGSPSIHPSVRAYVHPVLVKVISEEHLSSTLAQTPTWTQGQIDENVLSKVSVTSQNNNFICNFTLMSKEEEMVKL